ncbi:hypothetical protein BDR04DRAFT_814218 [Suillus decipiens]|nr:hypothetical protein BDR04DRAFT_814218 [Suillus decipiens]
MMERDVTRGVAHLFEPRSRAGSRYILPAAQPSSHLGYSSANDSYITMLTVIARRVPLTRIVLSRAYTSSIREGSVAQSKGFSKKEKAHEDEYARKHEAELLRKLKAEVCSTWVPIIHCPDSVL